MAHFACLDENNVVTQVIVVDNKDITDPHTGEEDEILGIAFCKKLLGVSGFRPLITATSESVTLVLVTHITLDSMLLFHQSLMNLGF